MTRPSIGITVDYEPGGGFSTQPWYGCRESYFHAVVAAGGLPLGLPHEADLVDCYLPRLDGLMITSGVFDVDPSYYGGGPAHVATRIKPRRTAFEHAILERALDADLPVLGIGGGHQLVAVALGGTLYQHLPDDRPDALDHEQSSSQSETAHVVEVIEGTRLHRIVGRSSFRVNSSHHQAVDRVSPATVIAARAPDGIVEAIESVRHRFVLGVQWHPEFYAEEAADKAVFQAFVEACRATPEA
jgi:putative glutamine amidotransferase